MSIELSEIQDEILAHMKSAIVELNIRFTECNKANLLLQLEPMIEAIEPTDVIYEVDALAIIGNNDFSQYRSNELYEFSPEGYRTFKQILLAEANKLVVCAFRHKSQELIKELVTELEQLNCSDIPEIGSGYVSHISGKPIEKLTENERSGSCEICGLTIHYVYTVSDE